eukprot:TRINITY_DN24580_c0_g1_i1.p1 TRINITY_DN24580_c0_g1~~TRINITY_DN24580_c0_g1_i1.p1  ORF type:complete len:670 (+),score=215.54 TRINITY_DN24580_c0_g1_i1:81-2090(+)
MAARHTLAVLTALGYAAAQQRGGPQKFQAPKWMSDDAKDVFMDIEDAKDSHDDLACENREKLVKLISMNGEQGVTQYRARNFVGLGLCELKKGNWDKAYKRLQNGMSEMNGDEASMLKHPESALLPLAMHTAKHMTKYEFTEAGTSLRRNREIQDRTARKILKQLHQQMTQQGNAPPLEALMNDLPGLGKTGTIIPDLVPQVPALKENFAHIMVLEAVLEAVEKKIAATDSTQKSKRLRLDSSGGKTGSLLYARATYTDPIVAADRLAAAKELVDGGVVKAFLEEGGSVEKAVSLVKRTQDGSGCKDKGVDKTCAAIKKIADIQSNGFGESRIIVAKDGKKQSLEVCSTNANVGILVAAKDGVTLTVKGQTPVELKKGEPVVFDFCLEASLASKGTVQVLFAQAWHPEFAAVERTTELRSRAKSFGLSEAEVKAAVQVVNDHAKKSWEKSAKQWRTGSPGLESMTAAAKAADDIVKAEKDAAEEAARAAENADGEAARKKALEELEAKRAAKKKKEEEAEAKRLARKKQLEEERAKRDPWLNFPDVVEAEKNIEELKQARRDANAKLEFDYSTQLTKDISAAERAYKKIVKKAKKAHKKDPKTVPEAGSLLKSKKEKESKGDDVSALKSKLEDLKEKKAKATEAEDFKTAKKLKTEVSELEEKIKKLEL